MPPRRILIIDDNKNIHADFRKVFARAGNDSVDDLEAELFGPAPTAPTTAASDLLRDVVIDSAYQGEEGIALAVEAARQGRPYYLAFVDVRMPPGIDGIQTIKRLWREVPDLQCVICTAYTDYDWEDIVGELGKTGNLLILKKPFDVIEVLHVAQALAEKVDLEHAARQSMAALERKVRELTEAEARLQRSNDELLRAKNALEAQAAELARKSQQLEIARAGAEAANHAKSIFLANISHELRTPLNGVIGMLHLLHRTGLQPQQAHYAETAKASAETLLRLINDILDFSKIEAGRMEIESIPFDLRAVLDGAVELVAFEAARKGLVLATYIDPAVPPLLKGDPGRLRQILTNLAGNAVKFTQEGEVVVRVLPAECPAPTSARLRFTVTDTGIGIPPDRVGRLFQSFAQVDSSMTRKYGGTGLGLAISKRLCEMMGGEIGVDSNGRGSTFWFTATLETQAPFSRSHLRARTSEPPGDEAPRSPSSQPQTPARILIADPQPAWREALRNQLAGHGLHPATAADAETAYTSLDAAAAAGAPFRAVLLDSTLRNPGAEDLARRLQSQPHLRHTALILMARWGELVDVDHLSALNFTATLTKPALQSHLEQALHAALVLPDACPAPSAAPQPSTGASPFDGLHWRTRADQGNIAPRANVRILLAEDNDVNQEVAREILTRAGYQCDAVANGRQAVEAVGAGTYDLVLMDCHMPEMDGFEATREIRRREQAGRLRAAGPGPLPIIAVTADALVGDRESCLDAGMTGYLTKPFHPDQMLHAVASHLPAPANPSRNQHGATPAPTACDERLAARICEPDRAPPDPKNRTGEVQERRGVSPPVFAPTTARPFHFDSLLERCLGDRELLGRVVGKFCDRAGADLDDIAYALADADLPRVQSLAHRFKSAAGTLSAEALQAAAAALESTAASGNPAAAEDSLAVLRAEWRRFLEHLPPHLAPRAVSHAPNE